MKAIEGSLSASENYNFSLSTVVYYVVNSITFVINAYFTLHFVFLATLRPTKTLNLNTNQSYLELWLIIVLNVYVFY